ncbi:MAG: Fic family protein [Methanoregula sp.]
MDDLTIEKILAIHSEIMVQDGGDRRVLFEGNLHQVVFQANLQQDPFTRAAITLYSLCAYHAFRDGNKRTARAVAEWILADAGYILPKDDSCGSALMQGVMNFTTEPEEIEEYFRNSVIKKQDYGAGTH